MRYLGGKSRLAKWIASEIQKYGSGTLIEPFAGALNITSAVTGYKHIIASDIHPDLIVMWRLALEGWRGPSLITDEEYKRVKDMVPSNPEEQALRAFVGFGCSFSGKWFGGLGRDKRKRDGLGSVCNASIDRKCQAIAGNGSLVTLGCYGYRDAPHTPGATVYCDPPYRGTTVYKGTPKFDTDTFLDWARERSHTQTVLISEYLINLPPDGIIVAQTPSAKGIKQPDGTHQSTDEILFTF